MLNHEVTLEIMAASALLKMLLPGDASYEQRLSTLGFQLLQYSITASAKLHEAAQSYEQHELATRDEQGVRELVVGR